MNVLLISQMYPDPVNKGFGIFIRREVDDLSRFCDLTVISPRPGIPRISGRTLLQKIGTQDVWYPRYFPLPGKFFNLIKGRWFYQFIKIKK